MSPHILTRPTKKSVSPPFSSLPPPTFPSKLRPILPPLFPLPHPSRLASPSPPFLSPALPPSRLHFLPSPGSFPLLAALVCVVSLRSCSYTLTPLSSLLLLRCPAHPTPPLSVNLSLSVPSASPFQHTTHPHVPFLSFSFLYCRWLSWRDWLGTSCGQRPRATKQVHASCLELFRT
jgi:hypothetical protein